MAMIRVSISKFVAYMQWCYENKCGYIMGAYGQNPKTWAANSWWFTQYTGEQRKKALCECQRKSEPSAKQYLSHFCERILEPPRVKMTANT